MRMSPGEFFAAAFIAFLIALAAISAISAHNAKVDCLAHGGDWVIDHYSIVYIKTIPMQVPVYACVRQKGSS